MDKTEFWALLELSRRRPKAVVFDLDSTIASDSWRADRFLNVPKDEQDWSAFHGHQVQDAPIKKMVRKLKREARAGNKVVIVTLRPERFRQATESWLDAQGIPYDELHLRPERNYQPGAQTKREIMVNAVLPKYEVVRAYDDNGENADMFRSLGIKTFQPRFGAGSDSPRAKGVGRYERSDPKLAPDESVRVPSDPRHPGQIWILPHESVSGEGNPYHVDGHWRRIAASESAVSRLRVVLSRVR